METRTTKVPAAPDAPLADRVKSGPPPKPVYTPRIGDVVIYQSPTKRSLADPNIPPFYDRMAHVTHVETPGSPDSRLHLRVLGFRVADDQSLMGVARGETAGTWRPR